MADIDKVIHAKRAISGGGKKNYKAPLAELLCQAIFEHENVAYIFTTTGYLPWSFEAYSARRSMDVATFVKVLTPPSIVRAFDSAALARPVPSQLGYGRHELGRYHRAGAQPAGAALRE